MLGGPFFTMEEFVVYILYSHTGNITYVGFSSCSIERFHWHNVKSKKGFTTRYRPWVMIHNEFYSTKKEAMQREKFLKSTMQLSFIPVYSAFLTPWHYFVL